VLSLKDALKKITGVSFVLLRLKDNQGRPLSHNVYWMSPGHDFTTLKSMPSSSVETKVLTTENKGGYNYWTIRFNNVSSQLAFFLNPQVINNGEEVLPSYWSDNYFSIPAGQSVTVKVSCPAALTGSAPDLRLEGWNIPAVTLRLIQ
jgi:hypothetical protein